MTNEKILEQFSDGVRMLMLCQRNKEGRETNKTDRASTRKITTNKEDFLKVYNEFLELKNKSKEPLRIYSCVNKRDVKKAVRVFKFEQLEADYYDEESRNNFYFDIKNRWISSLMKQNCRAETLFLVDIDDIQIDHSVIQNKLKEVNSEEVIHYQTKNGWHYVVKPFNPNLWDKNLGEIKKDALLLLDF